MPDHPRVKRSLRPLLRRGAIQFGVAEGGPVLDGVTPSECRLVALLDGTMSRRTSFEAARAVGVSAARWRELLDVLGTLGVLEDGPLGDARRPPVRGYVLVDGIGELARDAVTVLRRCGVGRVEHGRVALDVALAQTQPPRPDLVVVLGEHALDPRRGDVWLHRGVAHLPVVAAAREIRVGPLVGTGPVAPCLWCLDLHRTDQDEGWPSVIAQLCGSASSRVTESRPPADPEPGLGHLAAGTIALYAVGLLTGEPPPPGVSAEVSLPWPRMDHRRWERHPRCTRHFVRRSGVA